MVSRPLPSKSGTRCLRCAQETVRGELSSVGDNLAASVAPAVQAALAASLPKELSSAVKAGLDKQLAPAVAASLSGKPLQEAFRSAFAKQLVPAFEAATHAMFQQIQSAFAAGFEEHLQVGEATASAGSMAHTEWLRLSSMMGVDLPLLGLLVLPGVLHLPTGLANQTISCASHAGHTQLPGGARQTGFPAGGLP